jgi:hypothetical protein
MKFILALSIIFTSTRGAIVATTNGLTSDDNNIDQSTAPRSIFDNFPGDFLRGKYTNAMDFVKDENGEDSMVRF